MHSRLAWALVLYNFYFKNIEGQWNDTRGCIYQRLLLNFRQKAIKNWTFKKENLIVSQFSRQSAWLDFWGPRQRYSAPCFQHILHTGRNIHSVKIISRMFLLLRLLIRKHSKLVSKEGPIKSRFARWRRVVLGTWRKCRQQQLWIEKGWLWEWMIYCLY